MHGISYILTLLTILSATSRSLAIADEPVGTGTIIGKVVDPNGNALVDVIVTLAPDGQKMRLPLDTKSDAKGNFKFEHVPEGDYNLNARSGDTKLRAVKSLSVIAGKSVDIGTLKLRARK